jgi:hypothetical protein
MKAAWELEKTERERGVDVPTNLVTYIGNNVILQPVPCNVPTAAELVGVQPIAEQLKEKHQ